MKFIDRMLRLAAGRKKLSLKSRLDPVHGFTGQGDVVFSAWSNGAEYIDIRLRGVAGRSADIEIDGHSLRAPIKDGYSEYSVRADNPNAPRSISPGAKVEIRQNGQPVLRGVLTRGNNLL